MDPLVGRVRRFRALRHPELVDRWGTDAATKFDRAGTLYSVGGFGASAMFVVFVASEAADWQGLAVAALAIAFVGFVPAMGVASMMMFSTTRQICKRYDIDPRSKPPLSFKALKSPGAFDEWLLAHGRQTPGGAVFGSPK